MSFLNTAAKRLKTDGLYGVAIITIKFHTGLTPVLYNIIHQMKMNEEWKDILGYVGYYQASNFGRVRSLDRFVRARGGGTRLLKGQVLNPTTTTKGRKQVGLRKDGKQVFFLVHRLVMLAFVGECPDGKEVCHNDGDPSNNNLSNLRYDTRKENQEDRKLHGTDNTGLRNGRAKLTENEVLALRLMRSFGYTFQACADEFGISHYNARSIVHRKTWAHI